jgi:cytochrome c oxidase assembly protein subunit 15
LVKQVFMTQASHSPWLNRFAGLTAVTTLMLIGLGGLVTSHGVGMAVPDWPTTYGYNMFLFPISQWVGGIFYEHTHRLLASFVGLLTTILAAWLWVRETQGRVRWVGVLLMIPAMGLLGIRKQPVFIGLAVLALIVVAVSLFRYRRDPSGLRWLGIAAFATVILQGVLGGLRVVLFKDEIGIFHGTLAQLFLILVCALTLLTSRRWRAAVAADFTLPVSRAAGALVLTTTLLVLLQLILGAAMRHQHAGLAVPDFPLAYGKVWPPTDPASIQLFNQQRVDVRDFNALTAAQIHLHMAHRVGALLIFLAVGALAWRLRRELGSASAVARAALTWFALIIAQASLGAATIWTNKAADIATLHVVIGAANLVLGAALTITIFKFSFAVNPRVLHARGNVPGPQIAPAKTAETTA